MDKNDKLYIVTRQDISAGLQVAQSCHAAFHFAFEHNNVVNSWINTSDYIVCLSAKNEQDLEKLINKTKNKNIKHSVFRESDLDNQITAVCLEPGNESKKLCSNFKLALKNNEL